MVLTATHTVVAAFPVLTGAGLADTSEFRSAGGGHAVPKLQQRLSDQGSNLSWDHGQPGATAAAAAGGANEGFVTAGTRVSMEESKKQLGLQQSSMLDEVESEEGLIAAFSMQDGEEEDGYHTGLVRSQALTTWHQTSISEQSQSQAAATLQVASDIIWSMYCGYRPKSGETSM